MKLQQLILSVAAGSATNQASPGVTPGYWDGKCFYPQADSHFDLESYPGRWFQVAGTLAPFTAGCKCISARYDINDDGSLYVNNTCQRGDKQTFIEGTALPAGEAYGKVGVLRVTFPGKPSSPCPGPNYIVQEYTGDIAIVQSANYSNLFILSREQNLQEHTLEKWIGRAVELGTTRDRIVKTDQSDCINALSN